METINEDDRTQVEALSQEVKQVTGENFTPWLTSIKFIVVTTRANTDRSNGIALFVIKLEEAKFDHVLLPKRRGVERSFTWAARFRRLAKDYERLPETITGLHFLAFACLTLKPCLKELQCP